MGVSRWMRLRSISCAMHIVISATTVTSTTLISVHHAIHLVRTTPKPWLKKMDPTRHTSQISTSMHGGGSNHLECSTNECHAYLSSDHASFACFFAPERIRIAKNLICEVSDFQKK